jgi:hypothetical protein
VAASLGRSLVDDLRSRPADPQEAREEWEKTAWKEFEDWQRTGGKKLKKRVRN